MRTLDLVPGFLSSPLSRNGRNQSAKFLGKSQNQLGRTRLWQRKAVAVDGGCGKVLQGLSVGVVKAGAESSGESVACDLDIKGEFAAADELVGGAVGSDLHPLAADAAAVGDPDAFAVAIARGGVASVGVGLLHGAIGVEHIHVLMEGRARVLDKPCSYDGIRRRAGDGRFAAAEDGGCGEQQDECSEDCLQAGSLAFEARDGQPKWKMGQCPSRPPLRHYH